MSGSKLLHLLLSATLVVVACKHSSLNRAPDTPAAPAGPTFCYVDSVYTFTAIATDPDGDSVSVRFDWGSGPDTATPLVPSGKTISSSHRWRLPGTYSVSVQAGDEHDRWSRPSSPCTVTVSGDVPGSLKWTYRTGACITACPAIGSDGTIYVGSTDFCFYALNPDGTLKWRYDSKQPIYSSPAIGPDGTIYTHTMTEFSLLALTPDGNLRWKCRTGGYNSSPAVGSGGTVYLCADYSGDGLVAMNPDGTVKWRYAGSGGAGGSPAVARDGTVYAYSRGVIAVDSNGSLKWECGGVTGEWSSPAIGADGTIYFGSESGCICALSPDGILKWYHQTAGVASSPAIGLDGTIYVGSDDFCFYALNPDGTLKWSYQTDGDISCSPAVSADGTIYFGSGDCHMYALRPDGSLRWKYKTSAEAMYDSKVTIGPDGTVYVGAAGGTLYAFRGDAPLADSPWPKFHRDLHNTGRAGGP